MQVATIAPGRRVIHLIDRTTRHAAERARVDFVANASHELRTPLAAILGFIETLDDEKAGGDAEVRGRFLAVMLKEARRMQRLIDDLISLSRIEAEKYQLPDTAVALPDLIEEVRGEWRDAQGERRPEVVLAIDKDVPEVAGDRAQLSQVIHNLVGNAFKYGRAGTPITIALKAEGSLIRLSVTDEGDGIAAQHLPRLTERFYRVDSGRSRTLGGTGLGLAIVKHIIERHRGRLDIASTVGVGTTIAVLLPAAQTRRRVTETSLH
jgi:two-component system phosphate regulon sensor histidine kinase PhoR